MKVKTKQCPTCGGIGRVTLRSTACVECGLILFLTTRRAAILKMGRRLFCDQCRANGAPVRWAARAYHARQTTPEKT